MIYPKYLLLAPLSACSLLLFCSSINPTTYAQGSNRTLDIEIDDTSYPITYDMSGGEISNITAEKDNSSLVIELVTNNDGTLVLDLPRNIMDSKNPQNEDVDYVIFADSVPIVADEITTNDQVRTLSIDFENGVEQIEIAGTQIVPEFGPLTSLLLAVSVIGALAVTSKLARFRTKRN